MADLSTTAASNSPAGSDSPTSGDDFLRSIQAILRHTNAKGADIASASSIDLGAATGEFVDVTGTTTITSLGTVAAGIVRTVRFTGALTLTHNATSLKLPGGANITTAANDVAQLRSLGSGNWQCVSYIKENGKAVVVDTVSDASDTVKGIVELATDAETQTGTDKTRAITPANLTARTATATRTGIVELATDAEAQTGTDATRAVTPDNLGATVLGIGQTWQDLTGSRALNTTYTNSTGRTIVVQYNTTATAASAITCTVGGVSLLGSTLNASGAQGGGTFIVPPGATYIASSGNQNLTAWRELR